MIQKWQPPELLDLHGYVTPTPIEATTKPHNPSIEYDLRLKWNQARIDANEAVMNAEGFLVTRPINDWCSDTSEPDPGALCPDGRPPGPAVAEGWDDWGPFYPPMYAEHVGLNGSTVEMCMSLSIVPHTEEDPQCGPLLRETTKVGRAGARRAQYIVVGRRSSSTLRTDATCSMTSSSSTAAASSTRLALRAVRRRSTSRTTGCTSTPRRT